MSTYVKTVYFNDWIGHHKNTIRCCQVFILFAAVAQFASFGIIQAHVTSFYGAQSEDVAFALQITYAGIIATLPVQFRLLRFFNTRKYLIFAFVAGILLNIGCLQTHDLIIFSLFRFLLGIVTAMLAGCMLIVLFSTIEAHKRILIGVSIFFALILTVGLVVGIGASWAVVKMDWTVIYYGLIGLQILAMVTCLILFKSKPDRKPYPLYQIDWIGCILFMFGASALAFVMIFGPQRYWIDDPQILFAAIFSLFMLSLFIYRQSNIKRPSIDLGVFKHGKFIFSLVLMLLFYGAKDSINLIYGYSAGVLGWSSTDIVDAGLFNIAGVLISIFLCVKIIPLKKENLSYLMLTGFGLMLIYHLLVYRNLTPDLSFNQLCIPIFLQGFASGLLFVSITMFCMSSVPQSTGLTWIIVCAYARFVAVLNSYAGFYALSLKYNQQFKESFLGNLVSGNQYLVQRQQTFQSFFQSKGFVTTDAAKLSNAMLAKATGIQSQLLTIRAVFFIIAMIMAAVFIVLLIFVINTKLKESRQIAAL